MGKIITNRQLIDAPATGPRRYGLFDAATLAPMGTRVIGSGLQFLVDHCEQASIHDQTCEVNPTKPVIEGSELMGADPFWLVARKRCGTVGRTAEEMQQAARQVLATSEQTLVESVLWDGAGGTLAGADPTLTAAGATVVTPPAPGAGTAIAALESAFYNANGYRGVIHVNTVAYAAAAYSNLVEHQSGRLVTPLGTVWSFGAGYDITGPADAVPAAGFVWAFMTAPVTVWQSEVMTQDVRRTMDRTLNQWDAIAERVYAAAWDCPNVFAVQIPVAAPAVATAPAVP